MPQGGANAAAGLTHRHGAGKVPSRSSSPKGTAAFPAGEFVSDAKGLKPHHTLFGNAPPAGSGMEADIAPYERYLPAAILLVALCTRFYRLTVPWGVVFDEYHFGRFVNQYCAGTYLFDIHPPLGKLTLFFVGKLFGYDHTVCSYNSISDPYTSTCKFWVLRATAAVFGSATAPLMYGIARGFGGGIWAGVLCASLFIFDNLNLTEARLVLIDSQLIFWCAATLWTAQRWWRRLAEDMGAREEKAAEGDPRLVDARERNLWCLAMGVTASSAISIKWTALATPGMIAMESFFAFFFLRRPAYLQDLVKILAVAAVLYFTWFYIHFKLLPKSGDGDAFMRVEFQRTLFNNTNYDPLAPRPSVFTTFQQLNREMLAANARIELRHNWESLWWEWPLNLRGLLYYSKDNSADGSRNVVTTQTVYLLGNPAVIWLVGALVATTFASSAFYLRYKHFRGSLGNCDWLSARMATFSSATGYCLWVYVLNLLPYILVNRSAFIYHYMPALMYGEVMSALMVEQLVGKKNMPLAMKLIMGVVLASFCYYAPWVYAFPLTSEGHARRRLLKRWD